QPEHILSFEQNSVTIHSTQPVNKVFDIIMEQEIVVDETTSPIPTTARVSREAYIEQVDKIKEDIINGEVYELNYCIEFLGNAPHLNPFVNFQKLIRLSPISFATFQLYAIGFVPCTAPWRLLKRNW